MTAKIRLNPVDRVDILSVVDNVVDLLLLNTDVAERMGPAGRAGQQIPVVEAPLLESERAADTPVAEHGLSFLVSVTSGDGRRTMLFDTGSTCRWTGPQSACAGRGPGGDRGGGPQPRPLRPYDGPERVGEATPAAAAAAGSSRRLAEAAGRDPRAGALGAAHDQRGEGPRRGLPGDREHGSHRSCWTAASW